MRRRFSAAPQPVQASVRVNADQKARLERFWDEDTGGGALPFLMRDQTRDGRPMLTGDSVPLLDGEGRAFTIEAWWLVVFGDGAPAFPGAPMALRRDIVIATIDGEVVPVEAWARVRPKTGTTVILKPVPQGDVLRNVLTIAVTVAAIAAGQFYAPALAGSLGLSTAAGSFGLQAASAAITATTLLAGTLLLNALVPPRKDEKDKPTYAITGLQNQMTPDGAVPLILGRIRYAPPYAARPFTQSIGDERFVTAAFCCGYGPLAIKDWRIGTTPIERFTDYVLETRQGYAADARLALYPSQVLEEPLSIALLTSASPTGGPQIRVTASDVTHAEIDTTYPGGVFAVNKDGESQTFTVDIATRCPDWDAATATWITRETNNPASLFRYVLTGPAITYPLAPDEIAALGAWHAFCAAKGLTYNRVHDYEASVLDVLSDVAAAGRASPQNGGEAWGVVIDRALDSIAAHIGPRNSWGFQGERPYVRFPDAFRVGFLDETNSYEKAERLVPWPGLTGDPKVIEKLDLPGVTNPDMVYATGQQAELQARSVSASGQVGPWSESVIHTMFGADPAPPVDLAVSTERRTVSGTTKAVALRLTCDAPPGDTTFVLAGRYRATGATDWLDMAADGDDPFSVASAIVSDGQDYEVEGSVTTPAGARRSAWVDASPATIRAVADDVPPGAPTAFVVNGGVDKATGAFTAPNSANFGSVALYRGTSTTFGNASVIRAFNGSASQSFDFTDDGLAPGTYSYWVRALNRSGFGNSTSTAGPRTVTVT